MIKENSLQFNSSAAARFLAYWGASVLALALLVIPAPSSAQLFGAELRINPQSPRPNESVSVTAESFSFNTNQASFTWTVNGVSAGRGVGKDSISITTRKVGEPIVVSVSIETTEGISIQKQVTITPAEIAVVWEARTSTPLLYRGRALHSPGSSVTIAAFPNFVQSGVRVSAQNLNFTWRRSGEILKELSGVGRNVVTVNNPGVLRNLDIRVTVETLDSLISTTERVVIPVTDPQILLYEETPLSGINYAQTLVGRYQLRGEETTVIAEPYFFSDTTNLSYSWIIDGKTSNEQSKSITLRPEGEGEGLSTISVSVTQLGRLLQSAERSFELLFGNVQSSSFFNF